jgi:hypothetical protein
VIRAFLTGTVSLYIGLAAIPAQAGPYGDDMAKCLVRSTTSADRSSLVQWIFAAAAAHPDVKSLVSVSEKQRDGLNRTTAKLFEKLLTASCRKETQAAVKYEGRQTIQTSFNVLGQVAGRELFTDPQVTSSVAGLGQYVDQKKIQELFESAR